MIVRPDRLVVDRSYREMTDDVVSPIPPQTELHPVGSTFPTASFEDLPLGTSSEKLSLIIPAYNEERRISETIRAYARSLQGLHHEILVEVDGSSDRTADLVRGIQKTFPTVSLVEFSARLGKGRGVMEAIQHASGEWIAYVDADGSVPPSEFLHLARAALADGADAVIASRYWDRDRMIQEIGLMRWTASRGFNALVRHLYGLPFRDTQCGAKMMRRSAARAVMGEMKLAGYAFDVELLWRLQRQGFKVLELPIMWTHKNGSKIRLGHVVSHMFLDVMRLRVNP